jgi:hypothetical protein
MIRQMIHGIQNFKTLFHLLDSVSEHLDLSLLACYMENCETYLTLATPDQISQMYQHWVVVSSLMTLSQTHFVDFWEDDCS